jgi:hypothetical protein
LAGKIRQMRNPSCEKGNRCLCRGNRHAVRGAEIQLYVP